MLLKLKTRLLFAFWLVTLDPAMAQLANHNQLITLTSGAVITSGVVINTGEISNNGDWYVAGDWTNSGTFRENIGTVQLVGKNPQVIRHGNQAFYQLTTSGAAKIFEDSLSITNRLELTDALIITQPNSIFLMRKTATINGASDKAYVDGRLYWEGTAERFYPVGNGNGYAPLWLSEERTSEPSLPEPIVGINLWTPTSKTLTDSSLDRVSFVRYWERTVTRGKSERAYATLSILGDDTVPTLDSVVVAGTNDLNSFFQDLGQSQVAGSTSNGRVKSYGYANARWLAIGVLASPDKSGLIYVPNAFAPASFNDEEKIIKVYGVNIASEGLQLTIYNRWGNVVFSSRSAKQVTEAGWDGRNQTTQNEEVQGTYTYVLSGKFNTGKSFQKKGTITLIR